MKNKMTSGLQSRCRTLIKKITLLATFVILYFMLSFLVVAHACFGDNAVIRYFMRILSMFLAPFAYLCELFPDALFGNRGISFGLNSVLCVCIWWLLISWARKNRSAAGEVESA